jgi:hypothetical protein
MDAWQRELAALRTLLRHAPQPANGARDPTYATAHAWAAGRVRELDELVRRTPPARNSSVRLRVRAWDPDRERTVEIFLLVPHERARLLIEDPSALGILRQVLERALDAIRVAGSD